MAKMRVDEKDIRNADVFEILLDSFPDTIHSIDDDGRIVYANRRRNGCWAIPARNSWA